MHNVLITIDINSIPDFDPTPLLQAFDQLMADTTPELEDWKVRVTKCYQGVASAVPGYRMQALAGVPS